MKRNIKKILIINLFVLVVILIVAEALSFLTYYSRYRGSILELSQYSDNPKEYIKEFLDNGMVGYSKVGDFNYDEFVGEERKHRVYDKFTPKNTHKRPIVTIGCSYTEGVRLNEDETFAYKLNKYTGRTAYNRGLSGTGTNFVYRQLADKNFKNEVPDAEYFIYTFIYDHVFRQFEDSFPFAPEVMVRYEIKDGQLVEKKRPFLFAYSSFIVKIYCEHRTKKEQIYEIWHGLPLFMATIEASVKEMKKKYPNSKFVLLEYPEFAICRNEPWAETSFLKPEEIEQLEKMGVIYLSVEDLIGNKLCEKKYRASDGEHPGALAWDVLVPKLAQRLNL